MSATRNAKRETRNCVVIGGGLAGIAAAVRLADRGVAVTLVETRQRLGGRATSFVDPDTGRVLDNCQHVLLGCCTNLIDLYRRLGVAERMQWHRRLHFVTPAREAGGAPVIDALEADDLPAPLHLSWALLRFRGLTTREKLAIARGMAALLRLPRTRRATLHDRSFAQWLAEQRQPAGAIEKFWGGIVVSALNETPARVAADYAIQVFQDGFLAHEDAYVMGVAGVPLVQLYDAAEQVLTAAGGQVLLSTSAHGFEYDGTQVTGLCIDGERTLSAAAFVCALPFDRLAKLCPPAMLAADARLRGLAEFEVSPILGIHLWFARPVLDLPHLILTQSPLQWVFNKGHDAAVGGQHLHGVISAAHDLVGQPAERIIDLAVTELRKVLPAARGADVIHAKVIKEKRATFSATPGIARHRAAARGAITNLYLAGDWCQSGWPATMEGAVRSGYLAAAAALGDFGQPVAALAPDLRASWLFRWLAGE